LKEEFRIDWDEKSESQKIWVQGEERLEYSVNKEVGR
jgi:hypothetical protein